MFLRLHDETHHMWIGAVNRFRKSGQQRIADKGSKDKPGSIAPGFLFVV
jgi:hypothetical protein